MTTAQDNRNTYFEDGVSLSALRSWWSDDRTWTVKTYASINWGEVRIYDKRTSPRAIALGLTLAMLAIGWTAFVIWGMLFNNPPTTLGEWAFYIVSTPIGLLPGFLAALVVQHKLRTWYDRYIGPAFCERCGEPTTYPHVFDEHYDIGQHHIHQFCSTDCREAWERENVDYDSARDYDLQHEADENDVEDQYLDAVEYADDPETIADAGGER